MATNVMNGTSGNDVIAAHSDAAYNTGELVFVLGGMESQGGWPTVNILVNGTVVAANVVVNADVLAGHLQTVSVPLPAGPVTSVAIQYTNDVVTSVDDRNVYVGSVTLNGTSMALDSGVYVREFIGGPTTIAGQHDMDWNGTMTWSGSDVSNAMASGTTVSSDAIDGGAGLDTVTYLGRASDYNIAYSGSAGMSVAAKSGAFTDTIQNVENVLFDEGGDAKVDMSARTIDGGAGLDTLVLLGSHTQYTISHTSTGFSITGPGVDEWVTNVERLKFSDGYVGLDISGDAGQAYRLYQAAFNRVPDVGGLGYQTNDLDTGHSLSSVAANFIASPEFQATYGNVDNTQFITLLYQNVLHRAPDSGGLQYHLDELASGQSRADVLTHFSESPENQANVIGSIQDGMFFTLT